MHSTSTLLFLATVLAISTATTVTASNTLREARQPWLVPNDKGERVLNNDRQSIMDLREAGKRRNDGIVFDQSVRGTPPPRISSKKDGVQMVHQQLNVNLQPITTTEKVVVVRGAPKQIRNPTDTFKQKQQAQLIPLSQSRDVHLINVNIQHQIPPKKQQLNLQHSGSSSSHSSEQQTIIIRNSRKSTNSRSSLSEQPTVIIHGSQPDRIKTKDQSRNGPPQEQRQRDSQRRSSGRTNEDGGDGNDERSSGSGSGNDERSSGSGRNSGGHRNVSNVRGSSGRHSGRQSGDRRNTRSRITENGSRAPTKDQEKKKKKKGGVPIILGLTWHDMKGPARRLDDKKKKK